jgi:hypothetical protein
LRNGLGGSVAERSGSSWSAADGRAEEHLLAGAGALGRCKADGRAWPVAAAAAAAALFSTGPRWSEGACGGAAMAVLGILAGPRP